MYDILIIKHIKYLLKKIGYYKLESLELTRFKIYLTKIIKF